MWLLNEGKGTDAEVNRMLDANTEEASRELAKAIVESSQMKVLARARDLLVKDGDAQRILGILDEAQDDLLKGYGKDREASKEQIETIKRLQRELQANPCFASLTRAQQDAQDLLYKVVAEVSGLLGIDFGQFARSRTCC